MKFKQNKFISQPPFRDGSGYQNGWIFRKLPVVVPMCHNHHPNLTIPPQTITCIKHRPTIPFWCLFVRTTDQLEHLVWQEDYVLQCLVDCGAHSLHRGLICPSCPFIQGLAARQEREFRSSNSLPRGAPSLILCLGYILMDILHFTFLYILTVYSYILCVRYIWWLLLVVKFPARSSKLEIRKGLVMKLSSAAASITVTNPFAAFSGKTCKSLIHRLTFIANLNQLREIT